MLILQPDGASCGQACVAMAAGVSIAEAEAACGRKGTTQTVHIRRGLRKLGVACAPRLQRGKLPRRCIAKLKRPRRSRFWHWVLIWDGVMYDPEGYDPDVYLKSDWRIVEFVEIARR